MKNEECRMKKIKLKYLFQKLSNGFWGNEEENNENDIVCIRVADFIFQNGKISTDNLTIRNIPSLNKEDILLKGDILLEKSGGGEKTPVGRCVLFDLNIKAVCSNFITRLKIDDKHYPKYIHYLLTYLYLIGETNKHIKQTTGIQNLDVSSFLNSSFFIPPLSEQTAIANFLDDKTAKIDSLIEKKKKLIELYKEERTAVINHYVLGQHLLSIDNGQSCLSADRLTIDNSQLSIMNYQLPKRWEVKKLKYVAKMEYGESLAADDRLNGEIPVYGSNGVVGYHSIAITKSPCIIIGRKGSFGKINWSDIPCFPIDTTYYIDVDRCKEDLQFIYFVLLTLNLDSFSKDTGVPGLNRDDAYEKLIFLPPLQEQQQIVEYIEAETKRIDEKIKRTEKEIELLQEYRTALISEVVTGKIKV